MPNTPLLKANPASLVFDEDVKLTFALHNAGDVDAHVTSIAVTGQNPAFFHVKAPTSFAVAKGANHTVEVDLGSFNHHLAGHASLTVHSNAPDVHVALTKTPNYVSHGPSPTGGGEQPSTGDSPDAPSGDGWGGGGCFAAGTHVLMADGTARAIEQIGVGDAILAIAERDHAEQSAPVARTARIERVLRHDGGHALLDVDGLLATAVHRWGVKDGGDATGFLRTDRFVPGTTALRVYDGKAPAWRTAPEPMPSGSAETVYNFTTSARTYLVGASPDGPWYVVHNAKKKDDTEETGG